MENNKVVLLLSGGNDSAECARRLVSMDFTLVGLCISGIQRKEEIGAKEVAHRLQFHLEIVRIFFFDEETWNPIKLIIRDLAMGLVAIRHCKKHQARFLATGVKFDDLNNPKLAWLKYFLKFAGLLLKIFGITLMFPLMDNSRKI